MTNTFLHNLHNLVRVRPNDLELNATSNGRLSALTPDRQPARQGIPPTFTLYCLAYDRVLAGTIFNVFGMTRRVSFSSELGTLTTPICESYIYSTKLSLLWRSPIQVQTWPKLLNLRDRWERVFQLSQRPFYIV